MIFKYSKQFCFALSFNKLVSSVNLALTYELISCHMICIVQKRCQGSQQIAKLTTITIIIFMDLLFLLKLWVLEPK